MYIDDRDASAEDSLSFYICVTAHPMYAYGWVYQSLEHKLDVVLVDITRL